MKREIKFRAWDSNFGIMIPNVVAYGNDSIIITDVAFNEAYGDNVDDRFETGVEQAGPEHECITGDLIVEQFTGLEDKNGKEIYEGDIIQTPRKDLGVIVYVAPFFEVTVSESQSSMYSREWFKDVEVIGNIHEHYELIT